VQRADLSDALGPALAKDDARPEDEVLRAVHELERHVRAVAGAQQPALAVHRHDPARLADGEAVDDGLVVWADGGRVVENDDLGHEAQAGLGLQLLLDQHHALSDLAPLELLEGDRDALARRHPGHGHALVVDGPDLDRGEAAERVRADDEVVAKGEAPAQHRAPDHGADTRHVEGVVDVERG